MLPVIPLKEVELNISRDDESVIQTLRVELVVFDI